METRARGGMKSKGSLWYFFPFYLLILPPSDHKCPNGFIKASVCNRATTAKAPLSQVVFEDFLPSCSHRACFSSVTKPSGNQLHMLPQVFLQLQSFVCMW